MSEDRTVPPSLTLDEVLPELRGVVQQFLLKCKYPFHMLAVGRWIHSDVVREDGQEDFGHYPQGVVFYDLNASRKIKVGAIKWWKSSVKSPHKFRIVTRSLINAKYKEEERRYSIETTDPARALREMLTHLTPLSLYEMAHAKRDVIEHLIKSWKYELYPLVSNAFDVSNEAIAEEVEHLLAQGVQFKTPAFRRIVEEGIPAIQEHIKRQETKVSPHFIFFEDTGVIKVLSPHGTSNFTAFNKLPVFIQEGIGILKMTGASAPKYPMLKDVGAQVGDSAFWVLEHHAPLI